MRIIHVAAELDPFFRSGGLAIVANALPLAETELGHSVSVVVPFYEALISKEIRKESKIEPIGSAPVEVKINGNGNGDGSKITVESADFYRGTYGGGRVTVYFIGNKKFFGKRKHLYGKKLENKRFYFFDFAVLALIKQIGAKADIIHCHDWHTGLIPGLLSKQKSDPFWANTACVYTIHNLAFQMGRDYAKVPTNLRDSGYNGFPPFENSPAVERINFAKRAILNADAINTVSETYREEIFTKDFGEDLQRILKNRENIVFGIVNGINYEEYNPLSDPGISQHYSEKSIERRTANKEWLQKYAGFEADQNIPIICMTSRIAEQKGYQLVAEIIEPIMRQGVQFIIMGDGDREKIQFFEKMQRKYRKNFKIMPFDKKYETSVYAGSDFILLPSRFEPCGINQMIALRYGCISIVHHIGGFVDTIEDYNPKTGHGNGFVFKEYDSSSLLIAVTRALETFKYREAWNSLTKFAMGEANSWRLPAQKYISLYKTARKLHKQHI